MDLFQKYLFLPWDITPTRSDNLQIQDISLSIIRLNDRILVNITNLQHQHARYHRWGPHEHNILNSHTLLTRIETLYSEAYNDLIKTNREAVSLRNLLHDLTNRNIHVEGFQHVKYHPTLYKLMDFMHNMTTSAAKSIQQFQDIHAISL
jgi:hypothetical protein